MAHFVRSISTRRRMSSGLGRRALVTADLAAAVSLTAFHDVKHMLCISQILIEIVYLENGILCMWAGRIKF